MHPLPAERPLDLTWPTEGPSRVPYRVFFDPLVYELEQEKLFRGPTWNYVALEAELPTPGDFKATFVGDTPVVVTRDKAGALHAFVNRCAHRGALVCRELRGNRATHVCVYHQWSYDLHGNLIGVPFRKGIEGKGGYPADFAPSQHALQKLRILGYARQFIHANWKLYAENVRDPYHASLLHLFHTTFGIYRSSQGGGAIMDERGRHSMVRAYKRTTEEELAAYKGTDLRTYQEQYTLADPSLLRSRKEFDIELTNSIHSIFPGLVVQQIQNTLATRQILPKGPDSFELVFTFFGYEDDDEEMLALRIKQANLVGPAGYISMEDGHATEIVQQAIGRDQAACSFIELGGREVANQENLVTETALRGFWQYYRDLLGFN